MLGEAPRAGNVESAETMTDGSHDRRRSSHKNPEEFFSVVPELWMEIMS
jgi:hypothetical protein